MEIQTCRCSKPGIPTNKKTAGWVAVILEADMTSGNSLVSFYGSLHLLYIPCWENYLLFPLPNLKHNQLLGLTEMEKHNPCFMTSKNFKFHWVYRILKMIRTDITRQFSIKEWREGSVFCVWGDVRNTLLKEVEIYLNKCISVEHTLVPNYMIIKLSSQPQKPVSCPEVSGLSACVSWIKPAISNVPINCTVCIFSLALHY